ncbi:MAG: NTP transferase domain-containing protein [Bacteroidota bacterium]
MSIKKHIQHPFVQKPFGGEFHRNEISFLGAPCGTIQQLCTTIAEDIGKDFRLGYVDADHGTSEEMVGFKSQYTDKISHHNVEFEHIDLKYRYRSFFNKEDAVLVNGNHYKAMKQVVIINEKKKESLSRKVDRMTDVLMILLDEGSTEVFDFVKEAIPSFSSLPVLSIKDIPSITRILKSALSARKPLMNGLIFAGGQSVRMGRDKGSIEYHGKPQREYIADLVSAHCSETFISVQGEPDFESDYPLLQDSFMGLGPVGGLLSAFRSNPNNAWFAVACDIPMLDAAALELLRVNRKPSKMATCYHNPETDFPEPLITIWEPRAYPELLNFLSLGYSCPRKVLINNDVEELTVDRPEILTNVNTPEDYEKVKGSL